MSSDLLESLARIFGEHQVKTVDKFEVEFFVCVTLKCENPLLFPIVDIETIVLKFPTDSFRGFWLYKIRAKANNQVKVYDDFQFKFKRSKKIFENSLVFYKFQVSLVPSFGVIFRSSLCTC